MSANSEQTRQTAQPLPDYRLNASSRAAREIARSMVSMMDLNPPYQRGSVWTEDQRIALVKSWVMGVPIPAIIINDRATAGWVAEMGSKVYEEDAKVWAVVDGKQRIETAIDWFCGDLAVPASWFRTDWIDTTIATEDGLYVTYGGLTAPGQRLLGNHAMLAVVESRLPSIQSEAELYLLVNGGGTGQTELDMARAAEVAGRYSNP
jgi:hypothetical protein